MQNQSLIERLRIRASIRRQIPGRKSVQNNEPDRIADLLEEAANRIAELENDVTETAFLKNEYNGNYITDDEFDTLFKNLDDGAKFRLLALIVRTVMTHRGTSYHIENVDDLSAVVEQEFYERFTGRE